MTPAREVTVIVPLSRPAFVRDVFDNFKRQTFGRKRLVIVENGDAVGACAAAGLVPDVLLTSANHQASARNEALAWMRDHGGGFFANFDDDDYYGSGYLAEVVEHSTRGEVIGKSSIFVRAAGGVLRLFEHEGDEQAVKFIHGPTMAAWSEDVGAFPIVSLGEDVKWIEALRRKGATVWSTSSFNFMQRRYPGFHHTWRMTDRQMVQCTRGRAFEVGPESRDVVNGLKVAPQCAVIPKAPPMPWDHPGSMTVGHQMNMEQQCRTQ